MIIVIYIFLIALALFITKTKYKVFIRPNTIFSILWCFGGIISIVNNLGLIKPSLQIHLSIFISVITFNVVYWILSKNIKQTNIISGNFNLNLNYRIITIFSIIGLLLISPNTIAAIRTLLSTGFNLGSVRVNYLTMNYSGRFFYSFFTNNIPIAIFGATSVLTAIDLVNKKRTLLLLTIFNLLIGTITFGGRYLILNFIVYYLAAYIILKKYQQIKIRKSYIVVAFLLLTSITLLRGTSGLSVLDMVILYYVGSFSYLELILSHPSLYGLTTDPMYGYLTFGFIFEPFVLALKLFFSLRIDVPSYFFNIYTQPFVNIGDTSIVYYNNNTTMLYTFMRDFGQFGVIVGTALIAFAVSVIQNIYEKNGNMRMLCILVMLYSLIVNSTMTYNLTSVSSSLLIIFVIVLSIQRKQNILGDKKGEQCAYE